MEGDSGEGDTCPQLELRLGPPGGGSGTEHHWALKNRAQISKDRRLDSQPPVSPFGYFPNQKVPCPEESERKMMEELSGSTKGKTTTYSATTAVPTSSQKRSAPAAVVGWPPIRSLRKNLSSTSSNQAKQPPPSPAPESQTEKKPVTDKSVVAKNGSKAKGLFVKINMDGVPIGRKVDLRAYDSYQKLSAAVDELFRGLLAAQRDSSVTGGGKQRMEEKEEEKPITGLLDGRGEYTLVYEDYEGDRMLVGDVPWQMFISTVKRLRVLKSSELSVLTIGCRKQEKESREGSAIVSEYLN